MNIAKLPLHLTILLAAACSGSDSKSGGTDAGTNNTDAGTNNTDANTSISDAGQTTCAETPTRLIVLGDSVMACVDVGGKDDATCGPKIFHTSLAAGYAPGIAYENRAVQGANTTGVVDEQLAMVSTGIGGHVIVLVLVGGNDLGRYAWLNDAATQGSYNADLPGLIEDWNSIFAFFNDTANFPDGATIVVNNQYNPYDDCAATAPYGDISMAFNSIFSSFNAELKTLADSQNNAYLTDQYSPYLGHGNHVNSASCPHYQAGLEPFMGDPDKPNVAGHANFAAQWNTTADSLYSNCP